MLKVIAVPDKLPALKLDQAVDVRKLKIYYQENDLGAFLVSPVDKDIQEAFRKVVNHFKNHLKSEVNRVEIQRTRKTTASEFKAIRVVLIFTEFFFFSLDGKHDFEEITDFR